MKKAPFSLKIEPSVGSGCQSDSERIVFWAPNKPELIKLLIKETTKLLEHLKTL